MAERVDAELPEGKKVLKHQYKDISDEDKWKLLQGKDKENTQKATEGTVNNLKQFLAQQNLPNIHDVTQLELGEILTDFYASITPQKKTDGDEHYAVQTLKCLRAGLN